MIRILKVLFHMFFRLFFTLEYYGVENVPKNGAAVLAGNHPSYLDPILIYIAVDRPVRFLAWDKLFNVPLLGWFIRSFGAMPVNVNKKDSNAFEQAMKVLEADQLLGLFPEAGRSQHGIMESLKTGAARLAIFNNCPLVPITITGAYESWPVWRPIPLPRKITVKFHEPIVPDAEEVSRRKNDPEYFDEITEQWRERVNQRLLPGMRMQEAFNKHFARPASHLRIFEMVPLGAYLVMLAAPVSLLWLTLPVIFYYAYLVLDILALKQGRITKILRDLATPLLMLAWYPAFVRGVSMPEIEALSLVMAMAGLLVPYYWTNYYDSQRYLRGLSMTYFLTFALEISYPAPLGLHWSLPFFACFYALIHRPIYWYCQAVFVAMYAAALLILIHDQAVQQIWWYLPLPLVVNIYLLIFKFTAHDGRKI